MSVLFKCRVCGWQGLQHRPFFPYSSNEICACCGTQYGLDVVDDLDIEEVRRNWIDDGAPWFDDEADVSPGKPDEWSVAAAIRQIEKELGVQL